MNSQELRELIERLERNAERVEILLGNLGTATNKLKILISNMEKEKEKK